MAHSWSLLDVRTYSRRAEKLGAVSRLSQGCSRVWRTFSGVRSTPGKVNPTDAPPSV